MRGILWAAHLVQRQVGGDDQWFPAAVSADVYKRQAYGIHVIICSSDYQTVKESMHFGMNILNKFRERIVFALSEMCIRDRDRGQ